MRYRFILTAQAEADIHRIYDRLSERSLEGARRWYESFWGAVERLKTNPLACGFAYEHKDFPEELRHLLFGTRKGRIYRALFMVQGDEAVILAIKAPGEKPVTPEELESE